MPIRSIVARRSAPSIAAAFAAAALSACATGGGAPLSQLADGAVQFPAVNHRFPVRVQAIDDGSNVFRSPLIEPGVHAVRFAAPPVAELTQPVERVYSMNIQPCMRYYVAAQRQSAFSQDWNLVIEKTEAVGACDPAKVLARAGVASADVRPGPVILDAGRKYP